MIQFSRSTWLSFKRAEEVNLHMQRWHSKGRSIHRVSFGNTTRNKTEERRLRHVLNLRRLFGNDRKVFNSALQEDGYELSVGQCTSVIDRILEVIVLRYPRSDERRVLKRVERALDYNGQVTIDQILLKLELLDSISPKLGWKVFCRYPEEFVDEDAHELWGIMTAILLTTGFSSDSIASLLTRHPCIFANIVRDPDNLKNLFQWLAKLKIHDEDVLRVINRFPLILQTSVESTLQPRLLFIQDALQMRLDQIVPGIVRHPELLSVESAWLQERIHCYQELGLSIADSRNLFTSQPAAFAVDVKNYLIPMARLLRDYLECDDELFMTLCVKSGLLSRSISTVRERINTWLDMGFSKEELRISLKRFPRFLLYPISDQKYQAKLQFLQDVMDIPITSLKTFPQYLSYSLENRIAPRVLVVKQLTGKCPRMSTLAQSDKAFAKTYGLDPSYVLREMKAIQDNWVKNNK
eukprot:jgi/Picsp_1/5305/NSC_02666-R1_mterf domain-containing protein